MQGDSGDEFAAVDGSFLNVSNIETVESAEEHNYTCNDCNKTFKYKSSLKRHLHKHAPSIPPSCGICHQYFADEARKNEHDRKYHEARVLCNDCGKHFKPKSTLVLHMAIAHNQEIENTKSFP